MTVEIGNTDAEGPPDPGRCAQPAEEEAPALLITMATLTGAARVALGPDLPPLYTDDEDLAAGVAAGRARRSALANAAWAPYVSCSRARSRM